MEKKREAQHTTELELGRLPKKGFSTLRPAEKGGHGSMEASISQETFKFNSLIFQKKGGERSFRKATEAKIAPSKTSDHVIK